MGTIGRSNFVANSQSRWSPRHRHDRAGAVLGQHVVGRPDRDPFAVGRVDRVHAQEDTGLRPLGRHPVDLGLLADLLQIGVVRRPLLVGDQLGRQRGVGGDHHERRAEQRVLTGRVHGHRLVAALDHEVDVGALGPADPVALRGQHPVRPGGVQRLHVVQQPLGVVGDLEVPLGQLALGDLGPAALAVAVDDLLVGQHRLVVRAPVDRAVLPVGQPPLAELQEQPLGPAVVAPGRWCAAAATSRSSARSSSSTRTGCRCWRRCRSPGARRCGSRRSRRAGRRSPSPSGSGPRSRGTASSGPSRRAARTPRRDPCAGRRSGRGTSSARSASRARRGPRRRRRHGTAPAGPTPRATSARWRGRRTSRARCPASAARSSRLLGCRLLRAQKSPSGTRGSRVGWSADAAR